MPISVPYQSYPQPTELPAMREGELDGRYMDCGPALGVVGDVITDITTVAIAVSRRDGLAMGAADLQPAGVAWPQTLDAAGLIVTWGWIAPVGSGGTTYLLTLTASPTKQGRTFVRDWIMAVLPLMG